jgi:WD40 repeat protein
LEAGDLQLTPFQIHEAAISELCLMPDGRHVVTASRDHTIAIFDLQLKQGGKLQGHTGEVNALCVSPNSALALSAALFDGAFLWDLREGRMLQRFASPKNRSFDHLCLSGDGRRALGISGGVTHMWDMENGGELKQFQAPADIASLTCLNTDGRYALSAMNGTKELMLWQI